jgi:hypothetical protein
LEPAKLWNRKNLTRRKIDYNDDPAAPAPNSLLPAVTVVAVRGDGALLLIRRTTTATGPGRRGD